MIYDPALSHFDLDIERGRQGELFVDSVRDALAKKNRRIEVKTDAWFFSGAKHGWGTQQLYIERECRGRDGIWRPSGIQVTKAELWGFVFGKYGAMLVVDTDWLRRAAEEAIQQPRYAAAQCIYGENPTRGVYVNINHFALTRDESKDEHR